MSRNHFSGATLPPMASPDLNGTPAKATASRATAKQIAYLKFLVTSRQWDDDEMESASWIVSEFLYSGAEWMINPKAASDAIRYLKTCPSL